MDQAEKNKRIAAIEAEANLECGEGENCDLSCRAKYNKKIAAIMKL